MSLAKRCTIANDIPKLDLFVSLHTNAAGGSGWSNVRGWSCYIYGTGGEREKAAKEIMEKVKESGVVMRPNPIVYDPSLYVLKYTSDPAVLIEHGFHTNQEDVANLKDDAWRAAVAAAEAKGIVDYLGLIWVPEKAQEEPADPPEAELAEAWVQSAGIMAGYADGQMHLDDPVTRRQLMLVLYRLARLAGLA